MHARHLLIALAFQFLLSSTAFSQSKRISNIYLTEKYSHFKCEDASLGNEDFFPKMYKEMGLASSADMVLEKTMVGANGYTHYKYQQFHGGIPIFGNHYILHEKDGRVVVTNGRHTPHIDVSLDPGISAEKALLWAKYDMAAKAFPSADPVPTLCLIDPAFPKVSKNVQLAYRIDLESSQPYDKRRYFVDAHSGEVIQHFPLIMEEGVPSTAQTKYYGIQNIITDSIGPNEFILHDPTRGEGIFVTSSDDGSSFTNDNSHWDLTNEDQDEVALDAHYCTQQYYDMMLEKFGWLGVDGVGGALRVQVHVGNGLINAFWNGTSTFYGDGNCLYGPLTTLGVVGHEFAHGMINHTSDLIYSGESGAINESFADMFGKALEMDSDPDNFSWEMGHTFHLTPEAEPFRVMDDPNTANDPAYYKGNFWRDGGGVHTNSAIGNLWFSMLVEGKQDTNEVGIQFDVPAIGMDKAIEIAYTTNKNYLTESSDYHEFYLSSMQAAEELYGSGAMEIEAVEEAWKAVGLPHTPVDFDLSVEKTTSTENTCRINEYIPFSVEVTNLGVEPYYPSMGGVVTIDQFGLPTIEIPIMDTILAGEVLMLVQDDWLIADGETFMSIRVELELVDENDLNNLDYYSYGFYEFQSSDLRLTTSLSDIECFESEFRTIFSIRNNSCDTLPSGTTTTLTVENEAADILWSEDYTLTDSLAPFSTDRVVRFLDLPVDPLESLTFRVAYADDPNPNNNIETEAAPFLKTINIDYLNEFTDTLSLDNTLYYETRSDDPLVTYQGESYYGSTGFLDNPDRFDDCPKIEDFFTGNRLSSTISGIIRMCVDFESFENAYLMFDLMQFQNDADTSGSLHSSMFQAAWTGSDEGNEIIFGQPEGQLEHHEMALPAFFKGELKFKFYTEIGEYDLIPSTFPTNDVVLLDNLQLLTEFTGTTEMENGHNIIVSPNPAFERLSIRSEDLLDVVEIRDITGQLLKTETVRSNAFDLNISDLSNGVYLMRLQNAEGIWAVKRFVKMK